MNLLEILILKISVLYLANWGKSLELKLV